MGFLKRFAKKIEEKVQEKVEETTKPYKVAANVQSAVFTGLAGALTGNKELKKKAEEMINNMRQEQEKMMKSEVTTVPNDSLTLEQKLAFEEMRAKSLGQAHYENVKDFIKLDERNLEDLKKANNPIMIIRLYAINAFLSQFNNEGLILTGKNGEKLKVQQFCSDVELVSSFLLDDKIMKEVERLNMIVVTARIKGEKNYEGFSTFPEKEKEYMEYCLDNNED